MKGINNFSEIGKLNKVLLHRIGKEVEALVPENFERLLFDDIPFLKVARKEHDSFAQLLRDNDVEVIYYVDETAKALRRPGAKEAFVKEITKASHLHSDASREAAASYLMSLDEHALVEKVIEGVTKEDLKEFVGNSIADILSAGRQFYMDPMPNLYFTRDPGACVGNGLNVHNMSTEARKREAILLKYMYRYNEEFSGENSPLWYNNDMALSMEGGDVLVLNKETVAIGLSQRTTAEAIEAFAYNLLGHSSFKKIIVFDIPKCRAFMHLDTVFTMVDYDKFTIHPEIEGPLSLYEITLGKGGLPVVKSTTSELEDLLKSVLKVPAVKLIRCGGNDPIAAQREQWNDGSNTLCIAPGKVVTYERNVVTNDLLDKEGIDVLTIPSAELSRGRGGPRCMSCPVHRDDL